MNVRDRKKAKQAFHPSVDPLEGRLVLNATGVTHAALAAQPNDARAPRSLLRAERLEQRQEMREHRLLQQEQRREHRQQVLEHRREQRLLRNASRGPRARNLAGAQDPPAASVPAGPLAVGVPAGSGGLTASAVNTRALTPVSRGLRVFASARPRLTLGTVQGGSPIVVGRGGNATGGTVANLGNLTATPVVTSNVTSAVPVSPFTALNDPALNGFNGAQFTSATGLNTAAANGFGTTGFSNFAALNRPAFTAFGATPLNSFGTQNSTVTNGFGSPFVTPNLFANIATAPGSTMVSNGIPFNNVTPTGTVVSTAGLNNIGTGAVINGTPTVTGATAAASVPLNTPLVNAGSPMATQVGGIMTPLTFPSSGGFATNTTPVFRVF